MRAYWCWRYRTAAYTRCHQRRQRTPRSAWGSALPLCPAQSQLPSSSSRPSTALLHQALPRTLQGAGVAHDDGQKQERCERESASLGHRVIQRRALCAVFAASDSPCGVFVHVCVARLLCPDDCHIIERIVRQARGAYLGRRTAVGRAAVCVRQGAPFVICVHRRVRFSHTLALRHCECAPRRACELWRLRSIEVGGAVGFSSSANRCTAPSGASRE